MKRRHTVMVAEVVVAVVLLGTAGWFWAAKLGYLTTPHEVGSRPVQNPGPDSGTRKASLASEEAADPALPHSATPTTPNSPSHRQPPPWFHSKTLPPASDLLVLPLSDQTRLFGGWNFEIRETSARLIPAWLAIGGKRVTTPESWPAYARIWKSLERSVLSIPPLDDATLAELGAAFETRTILQVTARFEDAGRTTAEAIAIDVASGKRIGRWETAIETPNRTYEALFDIQCVLAPVVAAGLLGLDHPAPLLSPDGVGSVSETDRAGARELARSAYSLFHPPTQPRLMKALRIAYDALDRDPRCFDAWVVVAVSCMRLAERTSKTETVIWRELMLRSLAAGDIAFALNPDSPRAVMAQAYGRFATGRFAQCQKQAASILDDTQSHWLSRAWSVIPLARYREFPQPPDDADETERALWRHLKGRVAIFEPAVSFRESLLDQLKTDPFDPYLWASLDSTGDLGDRRMGHTACAIQGGQLALIEAVRQLELVGLSDQVAPLLSSIDPSGRLIPKKEYNNKTSGQDPRLDSSGRPAPDHPTPVADRLEESFRSFAQAKIWESAADNLWWNRNGLSLQLLAASEKARKLALEKTGGQSALLRGPGHGLDLSPALWLELAQRPALDAACWTFDDFAFCLGLPEDGLRIGNAALDIRPHDLALLEYHALYHHSLRFDNRMVDHYQQRMFQIDFSYGPGQRRSSMFKQGDLKAKTDAIERNKYYSPFHPGTLEFIIDRLQGLGDNTRAADYAKLMLTRFPNAHNYRSTELQLRALAEGRLIRIDEIAEIEPKIPESHPDRDLLIANLHRLALNTDKALELYETRLLNNPPASTQTYYRASWLRRLRGEHDDAVRDLETYIRQEPNSLATCEILLTISWIELRRGRLDKAVAAHQRAADVDSWKGDVIEHGARLLWIQGNHKGALAELERMRQRYTSASSFSQLGWAQLADGQVDAALRSAEQGIQLEIQPYCHNLKAAILRRQGKVEEALATLMAYESRMIHDANPQILLASHFQTLGDSERALQHIEEAINRARKTELHTPAAIQCRVLIDRGELDKADELTSTLLAINPVDVESDCLQARILLARGKPEDAIRRLSRALNVAYPEALGVLAKAELALGRHADAFADAKKANATEIHPDTEWILLQAEAAAALQRNNEARELYRRCLTLEGHATLRGRTAAQHLRDL